MRLISIFTFLMSSMVMYRSNSDHNVFCHEIWFHIKRNLAPFLVTFRSLLTSSEVLNFLIFLNILVAALELLYFDPLTTKLSCFIITIVIQISVTLREWDIPYHELDKREKIGVGRFGTVYK